MKGTQDQLTAKEALSLAMEYAAAHSNRAASLLNLSNAVAPDVFMRLAGQHPDTMQRDVDIARHNFAQAKASYEAYCHSAGLPAYATYNED